MERFRSIYPFTTENIAGYMQDLDLTEKKIITVTGSGDHVINAIARGARKIVTFDVNPLCKYYLDLKIEAIKNLSYEDFLKFLLFIDKESLNYEVFKKLNLSDESFNFFERKFFEFSYNGENLRKSSLFNNKYFRAESKIKENVYLDSGVYIEVQKYLVESSIKFICSDLRDLKINERFDYMFLSNIADYLNLMFDGNYLEKYFCLVDNFLVDNIYFAYIYDFYKKDYRSVIDNFDELRRVFGNVSWEVFSTALEGVGSNVEDAVFILRKENVR